MATFYRSTIPKVCQVLKDFSNILPPIEIIFSDNDAGQYGCRAINIAGVATQFFSVTISYECGKYDELGNIIALDEDCRHVFQTHGP